MPNPEKEPLLSPDRHWQPPLEHHETLRQRLDDLLAKSKQLLARGFACLALMNPTEYYDDDAYAPRSPKLQAVIVKSKPSPSPPPFIPKSARIPTPDPVSPHSAHTGKRAKKRKTQPSQGDAVLVGCMDPNRPDIARQAAVQPLNSGSDLDEDSAEEMDTIDGGPVAMQRASHANSISTNSTSIAQVVAEAACKAMEDMGEGATVLLPARSPLDREAKQVREDRPPDDKGNSDVVMDGSTDPPQLDGITGMAAVHRPKERANSLSQRNNDKANRTIKPRTNSYPRSYPVEDTLATSPNLGGFTIPQSKGSPGQTLRPLQSPLSSPRDGQSLPPFSELVADAAGGRAPSFPHRQSTSSSVGSPILNSRPFPNGSQHSPPRLPSISQTSPTSDGSSQLSPSATLQPNPYMYDRRPSTTSPDGLPYLTPSTEGFSPGSKHPRMSLEAGRPLLPPPQPSNHPHISHVPPHGLGGFKCTHSGCTAPPFATQYLLKYVVSPPSLHGSSAHILLPSATINAF